MYSSYNVNLYAKNLDIARQLHHFINQGKQNCLTYENKSDSSLRGFYLVNVGGPRRTTYHPSEQE